MGPPLTEGLTPEQHRRAGIAVLARHYYLRHHYISVATIWEGFAMAIDYAAVLADLKKRREKLNAAIQAIEDIIGTGAVTPAIDGSPTLQPTRSTALRSGTVASLSHDVIAKSGGPMKVADVARALEDMGKFVKRGRVNYGTVYRTLMDSTRFTKVGEGEFDIVDRAGGTNSNTHAAQQESYVVNLGTPLID
jgi:hypothetical protein